MLPNDRKKFWTFWLFWVWLGSGIAMAIFIPGLIALIPMQRIFELGGGISPSVAAAINNALIALAVFIVVKRYFNWWKDCWAKVELPNKTAQAVLTRLGDPKEGLGPDWYFTLPPFEKVHLFPEKQYKFIYQFKKGVYTKETEDYSSQPVRVLMCAHVFWPEIGKTYEFPMTEEEAREHGLDPDNLDDEGLKEGLLWGEIDGEDLLVDYAYPRLPVDSLVENASDSSEIVIDKEDDNEEDDEDGPDRELGLFLESAYGGASRQITQEENHKYWRENQPEFEERIIEYLTKEKPNPVPTLGLPRSCLNIELLEFEIPDETIEAYMQPELERKRADAAEEAVKIAKFEKEQLQHRVDAYLERDIPPWMAAIAASETGEGEAEQLNEQQMRDWMFIRMLGAMGNEDLSSEQELKGLLEEILGILKNM